MTIPREETLKRLGREEFDLLVVGGGATGCGIALDSASRGLKTALVERFDFAEGTSGRSTKLIHGGVRYLEKAVRQFDSAQYRLVREGLAERAVILAIAPHLAHPLPIITPIYKTFDTPYVWAGLKLYDYLAGSGRIEKSRLLGHRAALELFPALSPDNLKAAVHYVDGQFNDSRMALALVQTAEERGAACANHLEVAGLDKRGAKIRGAYLKDGCTGETLTVRAKGIINACGPFADSLRRLDDPSCEPIITCSTGVHIALDKSFAPGDTALLIPKTEDGRVLFVIPWEGGVIAGTTDDRSEPLAHPPVAEEEIAYLLRHLGCYLARPPKREEVLSWWSGVRPLVAGTSSTTESIVREHRIDVSPGGLMTVAGGKWTSYRRMACDAVDAAIPSFGLSPASGCYTDRIVLAGSRDYRKEAHSALLRNHSLPPAVAIHLSDSYGDRAPAVGKLCDRGFSDRLHPDSPYVEAEIVHAVNEEYALRPLDFLCRRTPLALLNRAAAVAVLPRVASLMGQQLNWERAKTELEISLALAMLEKGF